MPVGSIKSTISSKSILLSVDKIEPMVFLVYRK